MSNELMPSHTIMELVSVWLHAQQQIRTAYKTLDDTQKLLKEVFLDTCRLSFDGQKSVSYANPDETITRLKQAIWCVLIDRMEVRKVLSVARANELDRALESGKMVDGSPLPEITEQNIIAMMQSFAQNVETFLEQAVKEVFEFLRPRRSAYKTNTEFEVGERVILGWCIERRYGGRGYRVNYNRDAEIRALDNVFHLLDGKGTVKSHYGELYDGIEGSQDGKGETTYFRFKCFQNRNLHLQFKRMDLVARLNAVAGGMNLRKAQAA